MAGLQRFAEVFGTRLGALPPVMSVLSCESRLNGYPFGLDAARLPPEARILRVADIFQAMVQDRPYRAGGREEVRKFMRDLRDQGRIDADVSDVLATHLDELIAAARLKDPLPA